MSIFGQRNHISLHIYSMKLKHHIYFWLIAHVLLTFFFKHEFSNWAVSFFFVSFLLPSVLLFSYLFNQILIPKFLLLKKYWLFGLYLLYSMIASLYIQSWILLTTFFVLDKYRIEGLASLTSTVKIMALTMFLLVVIQSFILLIIQNASNLKKVRSLEESLKSKTPPSLRVMSNRKLVNIDIDKILFIESLSDYIQIHLEDGHKIRVKQPISKFYKNLPGSFIRIHRSFIVNQKMVSEYSKTQVKLKERVLPISRSYKQVAFDKFNR